MVTIKLAGVPEQVNIPISICSERGIFAKYGIDVKFMEVPEGTGRLLDMVEKGEADIALTVADATISACSKGRPVRICGSWVNSPLVWAIAAAKTTENKVLFEHGKPSISDILRLNAARGLPLRFGISRFGSGSHTMAQYCGTMNRLSTRDLQFEVANDFKGLRSGVASGAFDAFMWEAFTTKPWFDREELVHLGEVPTPWPAFVFTVKKSEVSGGDGGLSEEKAVWIRDRLFPALFEGLSLFVQEAQDTGDGTVPQSIQRIMQEHGHSEADARLWMSRCRYSQDPSMAVGRQQMEESVRILQQAGIVPSDYSADMLWARSSSGAAKEVIALV